MWVKAGPTPGWVAEDPPLVCLVLQQTELPPPSNYYIIIRIIIYQHAELNEATPTERILA